MRQPASRIPLVAACSFLTGVLGLAVLLAPAPVSAQQQFLDTLQPTGQPIAPIFEGWYANPDGTYTFSFGYHNFNSEDYVEVPVGESNFITPSEFDSGTQPTLFDTETGRRQQGVFTVTVPAEYGDGDMDVVWTIVEGGESYSVPGHVGVPSYQLDYGPRAGGSLPPVIGFEENGERGQHPSGIMHDETLTATVGQPIDLTIWTRDPSDRPEDDTRPDAGAVIPVGVTAFTHQGPAPAVFDPEEGEVGPADGENENMWTTSVTFNEPGDYVLRIRADNWTARDSSGGNQCCWSNAYVRVEVTE